MANYIMTADTGNDAEKEGTVDSAGYTKSDHKAYGDIEKQNQELLEAHMEFEMEMAEELSRASHENYSDDVLREEIRGRLERNLAKNVSAYTDYPEDPEDIKRRYEEETKILEEEIRRQKEEYGNITKERLKEMEEATKNSSCIHPTTQEEFDAWLEGYAARGGNPSVYSGINLEDGWYTIEKTFRTETDQTLNTWIIIGNSNSLYGQMRHLVVPDNVSYLGGDIGPYVDIYITKTASIVKR